MQIEQGYFIKQHIGNMNVNKYFLILEVNSKNIKSVGFGGTPTDSVILDYQDLVTNGYTIEVLNDKNATCITKYNTYPKNGISSSNPIAVQYRWSDQEYIIPLKQRYWNGSNWADIPEGFYE